MAPTVGSSKPRPRLSPDERIASRITRVGRFRAIDPRRGRPLPTLSKVLAFIGWAVLLEESFRRSRRAARGPAATTG